MLSYISLLVNMLHRNCVEIHFPFVKLLFYIPKERNTIGCVYEYSPCQDQFIPFEFHNHRVVHPILVCNV